MNPIVNPLFFYFAMIADSLAFVVCLFGLISIIVACICGIIMAIVYCEYDGDVEGASWQLYKKILKWSVILSIILWIVFIFIPSKEVLIEMEVAKYATPDNIKSLATEIIKAVKEMTH